MVDITLTIDADTGNGIVPIDVWYNSIENDLHQMAKLATLYEPIWEPKFKGAKLNIKHIESGLVQLKNKDMKDAYVKCIPRKSFYTFDMLLRFTEGYLRALKRHPKTKIVVT